MCDKLPVEIQENALILLGMTRDREYAQALHFIKADAKKSVFLIGRSHDVDIKVHDNSVSRSHSQISYTSQGNFIIEDNNSKFGTLLLLKGKQELKKENGISVQVDKSIITFGIKEMKIKEKPLQINAPEILIPQNPMPLRKGTTAENSGIFISEPKCGEEPKRPSSAENTK